MFSTNWHTPSFYDVAKCNNRNFSIKKEKQELRSNGLTPVFINGFNCACYDTLCATALGKHIPSSKIPVSLATVNVSRNLYVTVGSIINK